jgi:cytochrome c biogenesis protein CcmG, thiol:disulfide interchange protein DsbE
VVPGGVHPERRRLHLPTSLAARRGGRLERGAWWALLAALLAGRVADLSGDSSGLGGLESGGLLRVLLELRTGGFAWAWVLPAAVLTAALLARRAAMGLLPPLMLAMAVGLLPQFLCPASNVPAFPGTTPMLRLDRSGRTSGVTFLPVSALPVSAPPRW